MNQTDSQTSIRLTLINLFLILVEQKDTLQTKRGPASTDPKRLLISDTKSQRRTCHVARQQGMLILRTWSWFKHILTAQDDLVMEQDAMLTDIQDISEFVSMKG